MRFTLIVILLFCSFLPLISQVDGLDLSVYEEISISEKYELMEKVKRDFPFYSETEGWPNRYKDNFHFFDIDGDGDTDLIYDGWSGGEPMMVCVYLNREKEFKLLLKQYNNIVSLIFKEGVLYRMTIEEPGCCMPIFEYKYIYEFEKHEGELITYIVEKVGWHVNTLKPVDYFASPIRFEVVNTPYSLRVTPEILNEGFHFLDIEGNLINTYKGGDSGRAIAEQKDCTGRVWWYVIMDNVEERPLYEKDSNDFPMKYKGWMSSKYLKKK